MASPDGRTKFDRILNFRDVGHFINHSTGQQLLKPGLLFRSARPDAATTSDRQCLINDHKIKTIIDLRTPTEHIEQNRKHAADIPSAPALSPTDPAEPHRISEIAYKDVNFNGNGYSGALLKQLSYLHLAQLFGLYAFGWRKEAIGVLGKNVMAGRGVAGLAVDSIVHCKAEVKQVFGIMCDVTSYPVIVHCTQGKDRTGLVILLLLLLCGAPQDAIAQDYKLSADELAPERDEKLKEIRSIGLPDAFADCPEEWTGIVCGHIEDQYGGVEKYLEVCGVGIEQQTTLKRLLKA